MSNSASLSKLKFLLDENVKLKLQLFLKSKGCDVIKVSKKSSDDNIALISKSEERILITNDSDFANPRYYPRDKIFSVILLKIPQDQPHFLLNSFLELFSNLSSPEDFKGKLVKLWRNKIGIFDIQTYNNI